MCMQHMHGGAAHACMHAHAYTYICKNKNKISCTYSTYIGVHACVYMRVHECMCVRVVCTHIYITHNTHTYIHSYIHTYIHTYVCSNTQHTPTYCIYNGDERRMHTCLHAHVHIYICICNIMHILCRYVCGNFCDGEECRHTYICVLM